jgi:hypothetical protein
MVLGIREECDSVAASHDGFIQFEEERHLRENPAKFANGIFYCTKMGRGKRVVKRKNTYLYKF